jgi:hypothetical protein
LVLSQWIKKILIAIFLLNIFEMKTITWIMKKFTYLPKRAFAYIVFALVLSGLFTLSACEKCDKNDDTSKGPIPSADKPLTKKNIVLPFFVEGAHLEWWANLADNDVIYEERQHNAIMAPDGHQVTWGEFNAASGEAKINCTGQGTRLNMTIGGLIPNGVYSLFLVKYGAPGFDTTFSHITGFGVAGNPDGSENTIIASATGEGKLHVTCPQGNLSVSGFSVKCISEDEYEMHFVGIYHIDGQTHGATPGPAGTYVENFDFIISNH